MARTPSITIKRGDDFRLDLTVTDKNSTESLAAASALADAQAVYDAAVAADPQVAQDIVDAQAALDAAQAVYDAEIIVDITDWVITSKMSWCDTWIADFTVTILDLVNGIFTISAGAAATALWVPRTYEVDIEFDRPVGKVSSETFNLVVKKDITYV